MIVKPNNPEELICFLKTRPFIIYGMGYVGKLIAEWCNLNEVTYTFCDINAYKMEKQTNQEVISPIQLMERYSDANVVIASINHYEEIKFNLMQIGFDDNNIFSYLLFWPKKISWKELEESVDWNAVKERAKIFAGWVDKSAKSVFDYSAERNFLKEFLPANTIYYAPDYINYNENMLFADVVRVNQSIQAEVSSCLAVLMSFENPEELIEHICNSTSKSIILSYVTLEKLPDTNFRRSINYVNDFTEDQLINMLFEKGFLLKKKAVDPFDEVHTVYLFDRKK
ncbi:hypothetical protein [Lacrimispora sp. 38-1]|uniref:hypothetical protein n=1 Tax=Lacrimispora sp. 38-1 TaxID=3125778 RepID=UPI003CE6AA84